MSDFTFLTENQCFYSREELDILKKRENIASITDFSILLGGDAIDNYYYNNSDSLEDRLGYYWTRTGNSNNDVRIVKTTGNAGNCDARVRNVGARPVLPYSSIRNISLNKVRGKDGVLEVEYGEYPQKAASKKLQDKLEKAYNYKQSSIRKTGKTYTIDSIKYDKYDEKFREQIIEEYSFDDGKKYVRVKANSCYDGSKFKLSNGKKYKDGDYVWVEVQPIKWLIDEKSDIALSKRILFAGVQFNHEINYKGNFRTTDIKKFMDRYFSKEIVSNTVSLQAVVDQSENIEGKGQTNLVTDENVINLENALLSKHMEKSEKIKSIVSQVICLQEQLNKLEHIDIKDKTIIMGDILFENNSGHKKIRKTFKIYSLLQYLNLRFVSFDNVEVSGIDLSYTNADIDPQKVYNKDMSKGNYSGLNFINMDFNNVDIRGANFTDCCFDFSSLEGAIIDETTIFPLPKNILLKNINVKVKKL